MPNTKLTILYTSADPLTFKHMVYMYAKNAKTHGWWEDIQIIIWGAAVKTVAENKKVQQGIKQLEQMGISVSACETCARELNVEKQLLDINLTLKRQGVPLTEILKNDEKLLTI